jgi:N-glycosylase/DNA lyase
LEFTVTFDSPFSLEYTLESGQLFRWERRGEWWYGVVGPSALKVKQEGDVLRCSSSSDLADSALLTRYFRLDEDLNHVLATISKDRVIANAVQKFYGMRLVKQDTWECLASFVLATNANIPRIKKMVAAVCERYGRPFEFEGEPFRGFPSPEALAGASPADLRRCGLGYRAPFLRHVAASVADRRIDFARVESLGYDEARKELLSELFGEKLLLGVGPKVADCVLLFSGGKDEAFPIDVWIARALARYYPRMLDPSMMSRLARDGKLKLSPRDYDRISAAARKRFGKYAGYAQQYLYMAAREAET